MSDPEQPVSVESQIPQNQEKSATEKAETALSERSKKFFDVFTKSNKDPEMAHKFLEGLTQLDQKKAANEVAPMAGGNGRAEIRDSDPIPDNEIVMANTNGRPDQVREWVIGNTRQLKDVVKQHGGLPPVIIFDNLTPEEFNLAKLPDHTTNPQRLREVERLRAEQKRSPAQGLESLDLSAENIHKINEMSRIIDQFRNGISVDGQKVAVKMEALSPNHKAHGDLLEVTRVKNDAQTGEPREITEVLPNAPDLTDAGVRANLREQKFNEIMSENQGAFKLIISDDIDPYAREGSQDPRGGLEARLTQPGRQLDIKSVEFAGNARFERPLAA